MTQSVASEDSRWPESNIPDNSTPAPVGRALIAWGLGVCFYFYEFMLQTSMGAMGGMLKSHFAISGSQLGWLSSAYLGTYAAMQLPVGMLMDRYGPRVLLSIASLLCAIGSLAMVMAPTLLAACGARAIMGIGAAFAVVGCLKLAALWFRPERFALLAGVMVAVGMLGAASGQAPMAALVQSIGWENALLSQSVFGVVLAVLIWRYLKPPKTLQAQEEALEHELPFWEGLATVIGSRQTWIASAYAALMFVPTIVLGNLWGVPFLMEAYQITLPVAAFAISFIYFGWVAGGPLFGWFSEYSGRRRLPMFIGTLGTAATMGLIWQIPETPFIMWVLLFLLGVFSSSFVLAFSIVRELNRPCVTATSMGFINTLNSLSGFIALPLWGEVLDRFDGVDFDGEGLYSLGAYQFSMLMIVGCILIALVLLFGIKETYCQQRQ